MFPGLAAEHVSARAVIERLGADHRRIDPLLERGDQAFAQLPQTDGALAVVGELTELLDPHLTLEEAELFPFLRSAKEFPPPPNDEVAELYAQGFSWAMHGIARGLRSALPARAGQRRRGCRADPDPRRRVAATLRVGALSRFSSDCHACPLHARLRAMVEVDAVDRFATRFLGGAVLGLSLSASVACASDDAGTVRNMAGVGGGSSGSGAATAGASGRAAGGTSGTGGSASGAGGGGGNGLVAGAGGTSGSGAAEGGAGSGGAGGPGADAGTGGIATGGLGGGGAGGSGGTGEVVDTVTRTASTYMFRHFPIETNAEGVWNGPTAPGTQATTTTYDTVILENGYLKVTILPSYGGRVLSIVHKPTNRELLYQNPIGTPYLMQEDIFYYDYLVIMGGIFPSFPEPEHGKYWNQPYEFEVVSESAQAITIRMSRQDDRDLAAGVPARYDVGRTDVLVQVEVTLSAGSSALELHTTLTNTRPSAVPNFEYWTVTTLAPGSTPGQTKIPLATRILAQMNQVHLLESSWPWFADAETRVSGEIFQWNNLSRFENWTDQGTAFANPNYSANWSGLSNDENDTNVLRVSDNLQTPGLKLWTFGKQSLDIDVNDGAEWLRPTIEMWHGITPEFWARDTLAANEVRAWNERYFATLGLPEITGASDYGAAYLSSSVSGADTVLNVAATVTLPNQTVKAILRVNDSVVSQTNVLVAAAEATTVSATVPTSTIPAGASFEVEFLRGDQVLLSAQRTLP